MFNVILQFYLELNRLFIFYRQISDVDIFVSNRTKKRKKEEGRPNENVNWFVATTGTNVYVRSNRRRRSKYT